MQKLFSAREVLTLSLFVYLFVCLFVCLFVYLTAANIGLETVRAKTVLNKRSADFIADARWQAHTRYLSHRVHGDSYFCTVDRLVGQVVTASAPKVEGAEFESRLRRDFSGSSHQ